MEGLHTTTYAEEKVAAPTIKCITKKTKHESSRASHLQDIRYILAYN